MPQGARLINPEDQTAVASASAESLLLSAQTYQQLGSGPWAYRLYEILLERDPRHPTALLELARAACRHAWEIEEALKENPQDDEHGEPSADEPDADADADEGRSDPADSRGLRDMLSRSIGRADNLYRRADRCQRLSVEDYTWWASVLCSDDPPRTLQAHDVVSLELRRYADDPDARVSGAQLMRLLDDTEAVRATLDSLLADGETRLDLPLLLADSSVELFVDLIPAVSENYAAELVSRHDALVRRLLGSHRAACLSFASTLIMDERLPEACSFLEAIEEHDAANGGRRDEIAANTKFLLGLFLGTVDESALAVRRFQELLEFTKYEEWREKDLPWKVNLAQALFENGQVASAEKLAKEVVTALDPDADGSASGDPLSDDRLEERTRSWVDAQPVWAEVCYNSGRFTEFWEHIFAAVRHVDDPLIGDETRKQLNVFLCQIDYENADIRIEGLEPKAQDDSRSKPSGRGEQLRWLSSLAWAAGHLDDADSQRRVQTAETELRSALAELRADREGRSPSETEAFLEAYIAFLAHDAARAADLIGKRKNGNSWSKMSLRALAALHTGDGELALHLYGKLMSAAGHRLSVRWGFIESALFLRQTELATREARRLLEIAPEHVLANILVGDCLMQEHEAMTAGRPSSAAGRRSRPLFGAADASEAGIDRDGPALGLVEAADRYATALRLDDALRASLPSGSVPERAGSDFLSSATIDYVARKGADAAIRAQEVLSRSRLPSDKAFTANADYLIGRVARRSATEARLLRTMFDRTGRIDRRRRVTRYVTLAVCLALVVLFFVWPLQSLSASVTPETRTFFLAALAAIAAWPFVSKITVGSMGVEKAEKSAEAPSDSTLLSWRAPGVFDYLNGEFDLARPILFDHASPKRSKPTPVSPPREGT